MKIFSHKQLLQDFCKIKVNKFRSFECIKKAFTKYINSKWYEAVEQFPILAPLYKLLQKKTNWQWGPEQQAAFSKAKQSLTSDSLLVHGASDASPYGIGAVLSYYYEHDTPHATMNFYIIVVVYTYIFFTFHYPVLYL